MRQARIVSAFEKTDAGSMANKFFTGEVEDSNHIATPMNTYREKTGFFCFLLSLIIHVHLWLLEN